MPICKPWSNFTKSNIREKAPKSKGIYELGLEKGNSVEVRYIGRGYIESRLLTHISGPKQKPGINKFRFKTVDLLPGILSPDAAKLERKHLKRFKEQNGSLPFFNQRMPA